MRIAVLAPIKSSLYARLVCLLLYRESSINLTDIVVRSPWSQKRLASELRRDGSRLFTKIYTKMILGDASYAKDDTESIVYKARSAGLQFKNLKQLARNYSIKYSTVADHNDSNSQKILEKAAPDLIVFTGGGLIRKNILDIPKIGILNCHSGILPRYRGMDVVEWPAVEGNLDTEGIGLTLHLMDQGLDTGNIILQRKIQLHQQDTFGTIRKRLEFMMTDIVLEGIRLIVRNNHVLVEQKLGEGRQYFVMHPRIQVYASQQLSRYLQQLEKK